MNLEDMSNDELEVELIERVRQERESSIPVLEALAEADKRGLAGDKGYASLYEYCVRFLRYAEGAAFRRIRAARCSRRWPEILEDLKHGSLTLEVIALLQPFQREEEFALLLEEARGKSKRDVESMLAEKYPGRQPMGDYVRYLGTSGAGQTAQGRGGAVPPESGGGELLLQPGQGEAVAGGALAGSMIGAAGDAGHRGDAEGSGGSPELQIGRAEMAAARLALVRIAFTATRELWGKIERARDLLRHKYPQGRLEQVVDEGMETFLERKDPDRRLSRKARSRAAYGGPGGAGSRSGAADGAPARADNNSGGGPVRAKDPSRRIPQSVKDGVWARDGGRCVFISDEGRACGARAFLEFDHILPFAYGGASDDPANIRLLCRQHNQQRAGDGCISS